MIREPGSFTPPSFKKKSFHCPFCGAFAHMRWVQLCPVYGHTLVPIWIASCAHCSESSIWLEAEENNGRMLFPKRTAAPMAHPDMPEEVRKDYEEARNIVVDSPRGAAALLRLVIQKLCIHLGGTGKNLNDDIARLVHKGLPPEIQQALDTVRVIGNHAVHPGELSDEDVAGVALSLFGLVNEIVEDRISKPKRIKELYNGLPERDRNNIVRRDKKQKALD
ncbi:DUF4145 domain-containing protein [Candidatus Parcubacteria bacterium]|nr:MAG: DUF4145 domain-containing protein [Candidatus Parcubacteria bacterium]